MKEDKQKNSESTVKPRLTRPNPTLGLASDFTGSCTSQTELLLALSNLVLGRVNFAKISQLFWKPHIFSLSCLFEFYFVYDSSCTNQNLLKQTLAIVEPHLSPTIKIENSLRDLWELCAVAFARVMRWSLSSTLCCLKHLERRQCGLRFKHRWTVNDEFLARRSTVH